MQSIGKYLKGEKNDLELFCNGTGLNFKLINKYIYAIALHETFFNGYEEKITKQSFPIYIYG